MTHCQHEKDEHIEKKNDEKKAEGSYFDISGIPVFNDEGSSPTDNLIAGEFPQIMRLVTITGGELLPRGAVLGRIHTDSDSHCRDEDRYKFLSGHDCKDGSTMPDAILAETVDARCGDQEAYVYLAGEFNASDIYIPKNASMEDVAHILRKRSIFLRHNQA